MVPEHQITSFLGKVKMGVSFFLDAGTQLVEMPDRDPHIFEDILEQAREPWITKDVLKSFEMIGRRQLAVEAMFLPAHVLNKLIELPVGKQTEIAIGTIPVVTGRRNCAHHVERKPAARLDRSEAARVFGPKGIRSLSEQIEILEQQKTKVKSLGRFTLTVMNGKVFGKQSAGSGEVQKIIIRDGSSAEIEFVQFVKL